MFFPVIWQQFNTVAQCQNSPPFHLLINVTTAISPSHTCNPKTFETEYIWLKTAKLTDRHTKDFGILVMLFSLMCLVSNTAHTVALSRTASVCLNKVKRTLQWIFLNNTKQPHTLDGICRKRVFSDPDDPVMYSPAIVVFTYTVEYGITWSRLISVQSHISYCNSPALTYLNRVFHLAIIVSHLQNTLQYTSTSVFQDTTWHSCYAVSLPCYR